MLKIMNQPPKRVNFLNVMSFLNVICIIIASKTTRFHPERKLIELFRELWSKVSMEQPNGATSGNRNLEVNVLIPKIARSSCNWILSWLERICDAIFKIYVSAGNTRLLCVTIDQGDLESSIDHRNIAERDEFHGEIFEAVNDQYQNGAQVRAAALSMRFLPLPNEFYGYGDFENHFNDNDFGDPFTRGHNLGFQDSQTFADFRAVKSISDLPEENWQFLTGDCKEASEDNSILDEIDTLGF